MSLIKIIAYTLLGYVIYELYLGISAGVEAKKVEKNSAPAPKPATKSSRGSKSVSVEGSSGSSMKRTVGRGVV